MTQAQVALAALVGVLIIAATTLFIAERSSPAWVFSGFGLFGFLVLLSMILADARPPKAT
jgi:hypothetical protein